MSTLEFSYEPLKAIAAIEFLALQNVKELTKYKIAKLIFLADKLHLVRYGRTITGDNYCALEYGPIPSQTLSLLNRFENGYVSNPQIDLLEAIVTLDRSGPYPEHEALHPEPKFIDEQLSRSDIASLQIIIEKHGSGSFKDLFDLTHAMPAYKKAWSQRKSPKSGDMRFEDFFEGDEFAVQGVLEEAIDNQSIQKAFVQI